MANPIYRISKWREVFETADSRRYKVLTWTSMPTNLESNGFVELVCEFGERAAAIYGAWCVTVAVAASCNHRGVLASSKGQALTPARMEYLTRFPASLFEDLFRWASSEEVKWLEILTLEEFAALPVPDADSGQENPTRNGQTTDARVPIDSQTTSARPPTGLPNLTQPDLTQHNLTQPNRTRWFGVEGLREEVLKLGVDHHDGPYRWWEEQAKSFRRRAGGKQSCSVPAELIGTAVAVALATGELSMLGDLQARLREGAVRKPGRYMEAAITRALEGTDVPLKQAIAVFVGVIDELKRMEVAA